MCPPQGLHKFPKKRNVFSESPVALPTKSQRRLLGHVLPSASSPPAPPPTPRPLTRTPHRPRRERNDYSQLHYIFHHSRHLPGSSPSGREARSPQRAGAGTAPGNRFPRSSAQAPPRRARPRARQGEQPRGRSSRPGEPREPNAQARWGRARASGAPARARYLPLGGRGQRERIWPGAEMRGLMR